MASAVARAYNGGLGDSGVQGQSGGLGGEAPQKLNTTILGDSVTAGSRGRAPGRGVWGAKPPEAENNYTFHKPIFAEFWCHFGIRYTV